MIERKQKEGGGQWRGSKNERWRGSRREGKKEEFQTVLVASKP